MYMAMCVYVFCVKDRINNFVKARKNVDAGARDCGWPFLCVRDAMRICIGKFYGEVDYYYLDVIY